MAIGDGGSGLPAQKRVADQMLAWHDRHPFDVVVLLGDNIYPNGDTIRYGERRFTALYKPLIERGVQFKAILGNHDISGPMGVGWPTLWMSNQQENMRFFNMPHTHYDFTLGDMHFFMLNTNKLNRVQREWLREAMSRSECPWKIVCGHHPIYSSGWHGNSAYLESRLKPIIEQHGACLYLSAHEHDYERFALINHVTHIVSGGGGADLRKFRRKHAHGSLVRKSEHHFLGCELHHNGLHITVVNDAGETIDTVKIRAYASYHHLMRKRPG